MDKIKTVFLDVDGVLVDFNKPICEKFGLEYPPHEYNFFEHLRKLVDNYCDFDFWANLDWMPDGINIFEEVISTFGQKRVWLLTKPMSNVQSASGKMEWISRNRPEFSDRTIITRINKALFARRDTLLIDDCWENIEDFRVAGGRGLLINRPWNAWNTLSWLYPKAIKSTLDVLRDDLSDIISNIGVE